MKLCSISLLLWVCLCSGSNAQQQAAADPVYQALVGTWTLVSTEEKLRDGSTRPYPDLGPNAKGYLVYTRDGHMCATLMNPARPNWRGNESEATDKEKISAASGFTSYCGKYRVDDKKHVIEHYPEVAFLPNYVGTTQRRPYRLQGETLIFSDTEPSGAVERWTISWKKVPAAMRGDPVRPSASPDEAARKEIERFEDDARNADLRGDASFYERNLASDWTGGTSWGAFQNKHTLVTDLRAPDKNITNKETLSEMNVRIYGDTAIATYKEKYDAFVHRKRTVKTIITTDTFIRRDGRWVHIAAHSSAVQ